MSKDLPKSGRAAFYTPRQAGWILNVGPGTLARAIRTGALRTVRRGSRLVVPASELVRLLGEPVGRPDEGQRPLGGAG